MKYFMLASLAVCLILLLGCSENDTTILSSQQDKKLTKINSAERVFFPKIDNHQLNTNEIKLINNDIMYVESIIRLDPYGNFIVNDQNYGMLLKIMQEQIDSLKAQLKQ